MVCSVFSFGTCIRKQTKYCNNHKSTSTANMVHSKKIAFTSLIFVALFLYLLQGYTISEPYPQAGHVIIIGIDALSPDGIRHADTPTLDHFIQNGSHSMHARAVSPSSSGPNWGSMIMGAGPEQHGIVDNDWRTDNFVLPPTATRDQDLFPSIFAVIRDQLPEAEIGAILDWNPISNFIEQDVVSYMALPSNEDETTDEAVQYIEQNQPLFTFIHIDHVDGAGHTYGHGSQEYYLAVAKADSLIGRIVLAAKRAGMYENTVFMVSSDHAGLGYGHGGYSLEEMEIPFIAYGHGVKHNHTHRIPINVYDVPATALYALSLEQPFEWIARPVKSAFEGNPAPELMYDINHLVPAPVILPQGEGFNPPGGLFFDETPVLDIENPTGQGELRFTLDGQLADADSPLFERQLHIEETTVVHARLFEDGRPISDLSSGYFRIFEDREGQGLRYTIYEKDDMLVLPEFDNLKPTSQGTTYEISSNNLSLTRERYVAAVLEGYIEIPRQGQYTFYLSSDDGSKLYINGNEIIDNDGQHGVITKSDTVMLSEGRHPLRVEWFQAGGGYWLGAFIEGPDVPRQIIPPELLLQHNE